MTRAVTSAVPPAPNGMTKRTVRLGQAWADALKLMANNVAPSAAPNKVLIFIDISSPFFMNFSLNRFDRKNCVSAVS
jgi:hypothetical protein